MSHGRTESKQVTGPLAKRWMGNYRQLKKLLQGVCEEGWLRVVNRKEYAIGPDPTTGSRH